MKTRISAKPNLVRGPYVGLEPLSHMLKREAVLSFRLGSYTIRGNRHFEIPHIRIIRRVEDANVGGESGKNQALDLESFQEHFKRGGEEARVHRFKNKVIILGRPEEFDDLAATAAFLQTMLNLLTKVGTPSAKIIVA